jgi:hypothetical protein
MAICLATRIAHHGRVRVSEFPLAALQQQFNTEPHRSGMEISDWIPRDNLHHLWFAPGFRRNSPK